MKRFIPSSIPLFGLLLSALAGVLLVGAVALAPPVAAQDPNIWDIARGGQLISKSSRGFVDFHWQFFGKEGILTAAVLLAAPFVVFYVISRFIPIFDEPADHAESGDPA